MIGGGAGCLINLFKFLPPNFFLVVVDEEVEDVKLEDVAMVCFVVNVVIAVVVTVDGGKRLELLRGGFD